MPRQTSRAKQAAYLAALERGVSRTGAAGLCGVDRTTSWRWLQRPAFARKVRLAEATFEAAMLEAVQRGIDRGTADSPKLAIELLGRRDPANWRQRVGVEHEGDTIDSLSPEELAGLRSVQEWLAVSPAERDEQEREQLQLQIASMETAALRALHDRISNLLERYPHNVEKASA